MHGTIITQGPQNFQIISRQHPFLSLRGTVIGHPDAKENTASARVVQEETGLPVVGWTAAEHDGDDWALEIGPLPPGGPYRLETKMECRGEGGSFEQRGDMAHHLGVGDLFIIAGQSNATGYGPEPVYDPPELGLSVYRENGRWDLASHPLSDGTGSVHDGNLEDINPRHSPWLHCARLMKRQTGRPVGLIPASLGGSPIDRWDEEQGGDLYKVMVEAARAAGGPYSGILWYQGCSDAMLDRTGDYLQAFTRFVKAARRDLKDPELPIYTVQINRDVYPFDDPELSTIQNPNMAALWGQMREIQRQAARTLHKVYIVPAHDLPLSDNVHNSAAANITLGQRAAYSVLQNGFGYALPGRAPDLISVKRINDNTLDMTFTDVYGALSARQSPAASSALTVRDGEGDVPLKSVSAWEDTVRIVTARPLSGRVTVSAAAGYDYKGWPPHDTASGMPLLAFFDREAE